MPTFVYCGLVCTNTWCRNASLSLLTKDDLYQALLLRGPILVCGTSGRFCNPSLGVWMRIPFLLSCWGKLLILHEPPHIGREHRLSHLPRAWCEIPGTRTVYFTVFGVAAARKQDNCRELSIGNNRPFL